METELTLKERSALEFLKMNLHEILDQRKENRKLEPSYLEVGELVVLGEWSLTKSFWEIKEIDHMGNLKMITTGGSARRNFPNVDVLAGKLQRVDGRPIKGRPLPEPGAAHIRKFGDPRGAYA